MAVISGPNVITDGLVLYLDAANAESYPGLGTTWTDVSGLNNHVTLINGPTYNSNNQGLVVFDGVDDYADGGNPASLNFETGNFSLSFVSYRTADGYQGGSYLGKGNGTTIGFDFRDSAFFVYGTSGQIARLSFDPAQNVWFHHVLVFDRVSSPYVNYYRNGTYFSSSTTNNSSNVNSSISTTQPLRIALSIAGGINRYFTGSMPLIQIYNRALTVTEIQQNFVSIRSRYLL